MCEKQSARMPSLLRGMGIHFCDSSAHRDHFPFIIVIAVSMTRCHAASSKVHLHSSVRFSPCPVASFGSKLPWTLPLAFHPTVTSDAERDWEQALDTRLKAFASLILCDLVSHSRNHRHTEQIEAADSPDQVDHVLGAFDAPCAVRGLSYASPVCDSTALVHVIDCRLGSVVVVLPVCRLEAVLVRHRHPVCPDRYC